MQELRKLLKNLQDKSISANRSYSTTDLTLLDNRSSHVAARTKFRQTEQVIYMYTHTHTHTHTHTRINYISTYIQCIYGAGVVADGRQAAHA